MLEVKNLTKIYKPKKGVPVKAVNGVSLKFPEKGMVFLLGKSGSGKSTMLNLLGGLDKYDGGEIIIKGVSSKKFSQQYFDSYRNTYVGFIFQEYNVLEEFSVGANVALAIELQGRKATDDEINTILEKVDLADFGNRKPNELSGGQKQRVAIARALVKNPEIIMADEPTGALDSATGKQVLDTLKNLSKDKLVIVVSHDRDFAEKYADRIIELSDGIVSSDNEYFDTEESVIDDHKELSYNGDIIEVPSGYHLSELDRVAINEYIDSLDNQDVSMRVSTKKSNRISRKTNQDEIVIENKTKFSLIKSKLPMSKSFKIGANGLKYKKIRLAITIILSCIAFGLFGLADTFGAYNHVKTCTKSIEDSDISYASVKKAKKKQDGKFWYYNDNGYHISDEELKDIKDKTGVEMEGVFVPTNTDLSFESAYDSSIELTKSDYHIYAGYITGFSEIDESQLKGLGYNMVAGNIPDGTKNEIGISKYLCETFVKCGYSDGTTYVNEKNETKFKYVPVNSAEDMIGKTLELNKVKYTITCIFDTKFDLDRYKGLIEEKKHQSTGDMIIDYALNSELNYAQMYSLNQVAIVGKGFVDAKVKELPAVKFINEHSMWMYQSGQESNYYLSPNMMGTLEDNRNCVTWIDGEKQSLAEKEIVISSDMLMEYDNGNLDNIDTGTKDIVSIIKNAGDFTLGANEESEEAVEGYKIVGYIDSEKNPNLSHTMLANESLCKKYVDLNDGVYEFAVGSMPKTTDGIKNLVSNCYSEDSDIRFELLNAVTYELDTINDSLKVLSKVFLYIGIGFALFAALMLANFISTSITHKKQEIGILRAIGARSSDVFKIFFSESFIIAATNFVLSTIGVAGVTAFLNYYIRTHLGILITVLDFGVRQIALLLALSMIIAALASFIPVKRIASKRPIDAIRNR